MNVESRFSDDHKLFTISIRGDFDFFLLKDFREAYSGKGVESAKVVVDMSRTETIDSSALGMLLNMQKHLKKSDREITITNCNDVVGKIFDITHFSKKFIIE